MLAYGLIFGGCCSNVYTLELLVQHVSKSGNLITFGQFVIVAVIGLYANLSGFRLKKRSIPIFYWIFMVLLFSAVSVLNNYALGFNISMPLHIIFRSASLLFSMIIGYLFFNQRFSVAKIFGVILVTLGIVITTFETANQTSSSSSASISEWILGISILTAALILSCFLGQYQQWLYQRYPKEWKEGLFYTHILSLPLFGFLYQDLSNQISIYNASARLSVFDIVQKAGLDDLVSSSSPLYFIKFVPVLWAYLALNVITHYFCITGVHMLSTMVTSVTLNLILSIRKFVSLILSIIIFRNPFSPLNYLGTAFVVIGTTIYCIPAATDAKLKED